MRSASIVNSRLEPAIGAHLAALGGADALVFACDPVPQSHAFVLDLCQELDFLGLDVSGRAGGSLGAKTRPAIKVLEFHYPRAAALAALAAGR